MTTIASRDLRNHTADVLRQVSGGTHVTITVNGMPVAEISPVRSARGQFLSKAELIEMITLRQADPALRDDLEGLAGDTTDDLDPLRRRGSAARHQHSDRPGERTAATDQSVTGADRGQRRDSRRTTRRGARSH